MPKTFSTIAPIILKHAIVCFGDHGFEGVTTRRLAAAAGVEECSIYRLYKSKENLYQIAVKDAGKRAQGVMGMLISVTRAQGDPGKQFVEAIRSWYDAFLLPDARLLHQVLKQVRPGDKKLHDTAVGPISGAIGLLSKRLADLNSSRDGHHANAHLLISTLFHLKTIQGAATPTKEEDALIHETIENWAALVLSRK